MLAPPSTGNTTPVMNCAAGEHRKTAAFPISSGSPKRLPWVCGQEFWRSGQDRRSMPCATSARFNPAGKCRNGVYPDTLAGNFRRQRPHHAEIRAFGGRIGDDQWDAKDRRHGRGKKNIPLPARNHAGQRRRRQRMGCANMRRQHGLKFFRRGLHRRLLEMDPRIVNKNGDGRSRAFFRSGNEFTGPVDLRDVMRDEARGGADFGGAALANSLFATAHHKAPLWRPRRQDNARCQKPRPVPPPVMSAVCDPSRRKGFIGVFILNVKSHWIQARHPAVSQTAYPGVCAT